uniref:Uncharacterized protein n=1 Tax=viral metagenome TaxID=1070528 RepID=A0A6C0APA1_9ZZZZ
MTLTNFDASQITLKQKQKTLYAWKSNNDIVINGGGSVLREQVNTQSLDIIVDRNQGGCKCSTDALANPYQFNGLSQGNQVNF